MSFIQDKIYPFMPLPVQNAMISAFGYKWHKRRYGGIFEDELKKFRERESLSFQQWYDYHVTELRRILVHAFETVSYYNTLYKKAGFTAEKLTKFELEDISQLPVLTKDDLRKYGTTSLLSCRREKDRQFFSSSGSTGTPVKILFSDKMHQKWSAAYEARVRNWAGVTRSDSRGMIGGRRIVPKGISKGPFYRYNIFEKQIYFSAYHISPKTAYNYADALNKYKPVYMTGYAISNYLLASFFEREGISVPSLKAVITSSEKLTPSMRDIFYRVYNCKTYDSYSGVEACGLISENEYGQLLISPDVGIMEILNDKGDPCKPGEEGEIISTGFMNFDQPLIRYQIGDRVRLASDQSTRCGRNMVIVDEISGREEDIVTGKDGRQMVRFHGIYLDIPGIIAAQLIQHNFDDFTINLQVDKYLNIKSAEEIIVKRLASQLGEINVKFDYPDQIPKGPNGKFKAVISEITKRQCVFLF